MEKSSIRVLLSTLIYETIVKKDNQDLLDQACDKLIKNVIKLRTNSIEFKPDECGGTPYKWNWWRNEVVVRSKCPLHIMITRHIELQNKDLNQKFICLKKGIW